MVDAGDGAADAVDAEARVAEATASPIARTSSSASQAAPDSMGSTATDNISSATIVPAGRSSTARASPDRPAPLCRRHRVHRQYQRQ